MRVRTLVAIPSQVGHIDAGWEFEADMVDRFYEVKNGFFVGLRIHKSACEVVEETYSEKEWNDLKEYHLEQLKKEKEQTAIFQSLARDLTEKVKDKNKEIEKLSFFLECSKIAFQVSCKAIETLKGKS